MAVADDGTSAIVDNISLDVDVLVFVFVIRVRDLVLGVRVLLVASVY